VTLVSIFFGALLPVAASWAAGRLLLRRQPWEIQLGIGAVAVSFAIFVLLHCGLGYWWAFLAVGAAAIAAAAWRKVGQASGPTESRGKPEGLPIVTLILLPYGVWYFINALAPETQADGITYHLGLPLQYLRYHSFPERITFFGMIPQGAEMLYTMAFAFGRHSAAKLVEFTFFVATLPLLFRLGRRLGLSDLACLASAVFYYCAPVVGITGSSSYNDAAGVFFLLAAIYLVLEDRWFAAGALAGFCYAIKMPGLLCAAVIAGWAVARPRDWKPGAIAAAGSALVIAPWMLRSLILTGNPIAPLGNAIFPNPYFHIATETDLAHGLASFNGFKAWQVPWELAFGDHLIGTYGPILLALPLGLLALRRNSGRLLWTAALLLALPWFTNTGGRFLMQSFALAAIALAMALPRPALWASIALQLALCWPQIIDLWEIRYAFRLHEFPIAGAFRIEPETGYLRRHLNEYNVARMVEHSVPADARTLSLAPVANAYLDRDVEVTWHSAEGDQLLDSLRLAGIYVQTPTLDARINWPQQAVRALRFRRTEAEQNEWDISEIQFFNGEYRVFNSPQWGLNGWPNRWEGPLAFDGNLATRWRTWQPVQAGMTFEVDFGHAERLSSALVVTHLPFTGAVEGQDSQGAWHVLADRAEMKTRAPQDLRLEVARAVRRAGYRYLLVVTGEGGNAPIGNLIVGHQAEWGLEQAGFAGAYYLFRVK
jgi:hypothetical protein